jgi:preprotein translocase subunit SecG
MVQVILIFHVLFAVSLVALILIQQGKGATMGASFGAGASQTVFGSQGAGSFMLKITAFFALMFFITSLTLGHMLASPAVAKPKTSILDNVAKISQMQKAAAQQGAQKAAEQLNSNTLPATKK